MLSSRSQTKARDTKHSCVESHVSTWFLYRCFFQVARVLAYEDFTRILLVFYGYSSNMRVEEEDCLQTLRKIAPVLEGSLSGLPVHHKTQPMLERRQWAAFSKDLNRIFFRSDKPRCCSKSTGWWGLILTFSRNYFLWNSVIAFSVGFFLGGRKESRRDPSHYKHMSGCCWLSHANSLTSLTHSSWTLVEK